MDSGVQSQFRSRSLCLRLARDDLDAGTDSAVEFVRQVLQLLEDRRHFCAIAPQVRPIPQRGLTHRLARVLSAARSHRFQNLTEQEREHEWNGKVWAHVAFFHVEIFEPRGHAMFRRLIKMKWRFVKRLQKSCVDHQ